MAWLQPYTAATSKDRLRPVYVVIIAQQHVESNMDPLTNTAVNIQVDDIWDFDVPDYIQEPLFLYDADGWEFIELGWIDPDAAGKDILSDCVRGQQGTLARAYAEQAAIWWPKFILSTHTISDSAVTLDIKPYLSMPSGHNQTLNVFEGRTSASGVAFDILDGNSEITKKLKGFSILGKRCTILGGYDGMDFKDFAMLFTGSVRNFKWTGGRYNLVVEADWERLNKTRFGQIEDYTETLAASCNNSQVIISASGDDYAYEDGTAFNSLGSGYYAAIYYKIKLEMMRNNSTGGSTSPLYDVVRGCLGTTAAAHDSADEIDQLYVIEANPIDILLYLLISRDYNYPSQGTYDNHFGALDDEGLGCGYQLSDIDVTSFETIRDTWFNGHVWRCDFAERTKIRQYIENNILKVINGNLYINRSGKLSLSIITPPIPSATLVTLTEDDIIGVPGLAFSSEDILNDVTLKYDYDAFTDDFASQLVTIDATSQVTYDRDGTITMEAKGVNTSYGGASLASTYSNRKTRNFKNPSLTTSVAVLYNKGASIELGSVVLLNHATLPDPDAGKTSFLHYMGVVGKRIDWARGTIELDLINTNYKVNGRFSLVAPSGTVDYTSAADDVTARYGFACVAATSKMSNGDDPYIVI